MRLLLTPGQAGDSAQAAELLKGLEPEHVVADAAYDSANLREKIREGGGKKCIKPHSVRRVKRRYDPQRYKIGMELNGTFGRSHAFGAW